MLKDLDYEKLKKSLLFLVDRDFPAEILTDETHPVRVLERMEKTRVAVARRGVIIATADMIEATQDFSPERVCELMLRSKSWRVHTYLLALANDATRSQRVVEALVLSACLLVRRLRTNAATTRACLSTPKFLNLAI